jgi:hypothetical protein
MLINDWRTVTARVDGCGETDLTEALMMRPRHLRVSCRKSLSG